MHQFTHFVAARWLPLFTLMATILAACSAVPDPVAQGGATTSRAGTTTVADVATSPLANTSTGAGAEPTIVPSQSATSSSDPVAATSPAPSVDSVAVSSSGPVNSASITLIDRNGGVKEQIEGAGVGLAQIDPQTALPCGEFRWSPDGWRFPSKDGIWTLSSDQQAAPQFAPISGSFFRWSPDGTQLAWKAGVDEHLDAIRVGGPDGDNQRAIAGTHWGATGMIAWSPDAALVLSGKLEAQANGGGFRVVDERGQNPTWSQSDDALLWTTIDVTDTNATIKVIQADHNPTPLVRGTINVSVTDLNATAYDLQQLPLRTLPNGNVLVSLPFAPLGDGAGTYLVRNNRAERIAPDQLCDVSADGTQMLTLATDGTINLRNVADGAQVARIGTGIAAAFRLSQGLPSPTAPLAAKSPTLKLTTPPTQNDAVKELQQRLNDQGFKAGTVDGVFGAQTEQAVKAFQTKNGLVTDGIVGPKTWAVLRFDPAGATKELTSIPGPGN